MWLIKKPSYPCFMKIEKKQKQNKKPKPTCLNCYF